MEADQFSSIFTRNIFTRNIFTLGLTFQFQEARIYCHIAGLGVWPRACMPSRSPFVTWIPSITAYFSMLSTGSQSNSLLVATWSVFSTRSWPFHTLVNKDCINKPNVKKAASLLSNNNDHEMMSFWISVLLSTQKWPLNVFISSTAALQTYQLRSLISHETAWFYFHFKKPCTDLLLLAY